MKNVRRRFVVMGVLGGLVVCSTPLLWPRAMAGSKKTPADLKRAAKAVSKKTLKKHLFYLASDELSGRQTGTPGGNKAALYLAAQYQKCGLKPAGTEGYFQPYGPAVPRGEVKDANFMHVAKTKSASSVHTFKYGIDFQPCSASGTGYIDGPVIFAGYGITAPDLNYDDYKTIKVKDKIVLVFDHIPLEKNDGSPFAGGKLNAHRSILAKAKNAEKHGASALLIARDFENHPDEKGLPSGAQWTWPPKKDAERVKIPVIYVSKKVASIIARNGRRSIKQLQAAIETKGQPSSRALGVYPTILEISDKGPPTGGVKNVIALKEGSDPILKKEYIVISAHYDHVGRGNKQNSRGGIGEIHNGADDNASGTSGILELARVVQKLKLKRSVLFMSFDGEEAGLLGSKHYAANPLVPMNKIVTILNMDMISRNKPTEIFVGGIGRNAMLDDCIRRISSKYKLTLNPKGMDQY
ncbi:MAG: M28 family peptidase, partial [Planctomycetota bacterium]|nr:M28 family peptidase [Planctomycetota bacterium]